MAAGSSPTWCMQQKCAYHLQNQRGNTGEDREDTKKLHKIPENRITSTTAQDAHWGSGVCFFP